MLLRTDDDLYRFEGRLIDLQGTALPAHFRYRILGLFALNTTTAWLALAVLGFGLENTLLFGTAAAVIFTMWVADRIGPETPIKARLGILRCEARSVRLLTARAAHRPRPVTIRRRRTP